MTTTGALPTPLQESVGGTQQNVSKHLGVLLRAGLVARTKEGTSAR